jgi:hypothetical protein
MYQREPELSVQPLRHPRLMQLLLSGGWLLHGCRSCLKCRQSSGILDAPVDCCCLFASMSTRANGLQVHRCLKLGLCDCIHSCRLRHLRHQ